MALDCEQLEKDLDFIYHLARAEPLLYLCEIELASTHRLKVIALSLMEAVESPHRLTPTEEFAVQLIVPEFFHCKEAFRHHLQVFQEHVQSVLMDLTRYDC